MKLKHSFTRLISFLNSAFLTAAIMTMGPIAVAQQLADPLSYPFYDPESSNSCQQQSTAGASINPRTVFMIGDSITVGARTAIEAAIRGQNLTIDIEALSSRRLSSGSDPLDGQTVLESSADRFREAGAVIIALGTNNGLSATSIETAVQTIRAQSKARIFWVNIGVDNSKRSSPLDATGSNDALKNAAASLNITVVDWASAMQNHPEYISDDGYGVHTTEEGSVAFADTITRALSGSASGGNCGTEVSGCEANERAVWDFFIGKGLQPHMAAGFMGNMQAEAHFEPRLVEYGYRNSRGEISRAGQPSSLDLQIPPNQNEKGQPGYGIIQFTSPSRKQHLQEVADRMGRPPCDLGAQLEAVWEELNGPYLNSTLNPVRATTSAGDAAEIITRRYEVPGNLSRAITERRAAAESFLIKYGSGS